MRSISKSIALALCLNIVFTPLSYAIAGGGNSSGSSSHSSPSHSSGSSGYSKPSGGSGSGSSHSTKPSSGSSSSPSTPPSGYSKPSPSSNSHPAPHSQPSPPTTTNSHSAKPSHEYNKPNTSNTSNTAPPTSSVPSTPLGSASNKKVSADSYKAYQAERSSASKAPQPVRTSDIKNNPAKTNYQNTDQYMTKRTTIINNYNNAHPGWGSMGQGMSPNYGMWSNSFLTGMVMGYVGSSLLSNSMWMYSHMREPWYPSYRADLEAQAANNAELKSKLVAMDSEIAKLKSENAMPLQPNSLPDNVDAALAIAPEIMMIEEDHNNGMNWWFAPIFFTIGLGVAFFAVKLFK